MINMITIPCSGCGEPLTITLASYNHKKKTLGRNAFYHLPCFKKWTKANRSVKLHKNVSMGRSIYDI